MIYLIPDTNQWIYLANSKDPFSDNFQEGHHFELLAKLKELVTEGKVTILVNEIIEAEWKRNRGHAEALINRLKNRKAEKIKQITQVKSSISAGSAETLDKICSELDDTFEKEIKKNEQHIINVEQLLESCERFEISLEVKAKVADWAIEKKAPFHTGKNSMADAAILFGAADYIRSKGIEDLLGTIIYPSSYFLSGNKSDFASTVNAEEIHPDLAALLNEVEMKYRRSLASAVHELAVHLITYKDLEIFEADMERFSDLDSGTCQEWSGEGNFHMDTVYFGGPFEIYEVQEEEADEIGNGKKPVDTKRSLLIQRGHCEGCGAAHIRCECDEIISIEHIEDGEVFECEGCGTKFELYNEHLGSGLFEEVIYLAR